MLVEHSYQSGYWLILRRLAALPSVDDGAHIMRFKHMRRLWRRRCLLSSFREAMRTHPACRWLEYDSSLRLGERQRAFHDEAGKTPLVHWAVPATFIGGAAVASERRISRIKSDDDLLICKYTGVSFSALKDDSATKGRRALLGRNESLTENSLARKSTHFCLT